MSDVEEVPPTLEMDAEIKRRLQGLKRTRRSNRSLATQAINAANVLIGDNEKENREAQLRGYLAVLEAKLKKLEEIDDEILMLVADDQVDIESNSANEYVLNINVAIAQINSKLKTEQPESSTSSPGATASRGSSVKLPKVNIEKFEGDLTSYPTFMDSYESIIHNNKTLSPVEKFYYLKGLLKGKAAATIEGLSMTNDNYESAIELIKSRFGDRKSLQAHFIDSLMKLKPVENVKDIKSLRVLHDKIESIVRNLKTLGIDDSTYGPLLMPCILQKLPSDISLSITKSTCTEESEDWDFQQVISEFERELKAREKCQFVSKPASGSRPVPPTPRPSAYRRNPDSSFHTQDQQQSCVFCKGSHSTWQCDVVTDIAHRHVLYKKQNGASTVCGRIISNVTANPDSHVETAAADTTHPSAIQTKSPMRRKQPVQPHNLQALMCLIQCQI